MLDKNGETEYDLYNKLYFLREMWIMTRMPEGKYAWTVKVGEKGQFVVPKEAREIFDIHPGDTLILLGDVERGIAIPLKETFAQMYDTIFGQEEERR